MNRLDPRLRAAGLNYTTRLLLDLWADHRPHDFPIPTVCALCRHLYAASGPYCPTTQTIRPLLLRRRHDRDLVKLIDLILTPIQRYDLFTTAKPSTWHHNHPHHPAPTPQPAGPPIPATPALF